MELPKLDIEIKQTINQNVIVLIVSLAALGFAEYHQMKYLFGLSFIISIFMALVVCWSMAWYSWHYVRKKKKEP